VGEVMDYYLAKLEKSVASTVIAPAAIPDEDVFLSVSFSISF
jgi:hypothetical protein